MSRHVSTQKSCLPQERNRRPTLSPHASTSIDVWNFVFFRQAGRDRLPYPMVTNPATAAIDRLIELEARGEYLCKFRSASNKHHLECLEKGTLWIPDTTLLNDPFDSKPTVLLQTDDYEARTIIQQHVLGTGVLCFSGPLDGGPEEVLRWSHYADGHRGFCLLLRHPELNRQARSVSYLPNYPDLAGVTPADPEFWSKVGFFKAPCWRYEAERRIIFSGRANQEYSLPENAIWGVVFGCWSKQADRHLVARLALGRSRECRFFQARIQINEFRLRYDVVTPEYRLMYQYPPISRLQEPSLIQTPSQ